MLQNFCFSAPILLTFSNLGSILLHLRVKARSYLLGWFLGRPYMDTLSQSKSASAAFSVCTKISCEDLRKVWGPQHTKIERVLSILDIQYWLYRVSSLRLAMTTVWYMYQGDSWRTERFSRHVIWLTEPATNTSSSWIMSVDDFSLQT